MKDDSMTAGEQAYEAAFAAGQAAAQAGNPTNPFPAETPDHEAWAEGYSAVADAK